MKLGPGWWTRIRLNKIVRYKKQRWKVTNFQKTWKISLKEPMLTHMSLVKGNTAFRCGALGYRAFVLKWIPLEDILKGVSSLRSSSGS